MTAAGISYMGTKRELAGSVARIISSAKPGMMLDAFAGMGAVAEAVSSNRNVWLNDIQQFAHLVGKCVFTSRESPKDISFFIDNCKPDYDAHLQRAVDRNLQSLTASASAVSAESYARMHDALDASRESAVAGDEYSCFFQTYRDGFFSGLQSAQIDSIKYAIDLAKTRKVLNYNQWQWSVAALGRACLRIANTPGHFAQYLTPSESNYKRVQKQWKRDVWNEWLIGLQIMRPVGTVRWRASNKVTNLDSLSLITKSNGCNVGVVYCDPPYTSDQYSRYYHIWETLIEYDYPVVTGAGRYRADRFSTPFSIKTKAVSAMTDLIASISESGSDMVLSYPSNGLIYDAGGDPESILNQHFKTVKLSLDFDHNHSTFGASKGSAKSIVREQVFHASNKAN